MDRAHARGTEKLLGGAGGAAPRSEDSCRVLPFRVGFRKAGSALRSYRFYFILFFFPALARLKVRAPQNILAALATLDTTSICLFKK